MKEEIDKELKELFGERFAELWWDLRLPHFGGKTPGEAAEQDIQSVADYVSTYREV